MMNRRERCGSSEGQRRCPNVAGFFGGRDLRVASRSSARSFKKLTYYQRRLAYIHTQVPLWPRVRFG